MAAILILPCERNLGRVQCPGPRVGPEKIVGDRGHFPFSQNFRTFLNGKRFVSSSHWKIPGKSGKSNVPKGIKHFNSVAIMVSRRVTGSAPYRALRSTGTTFHLSENPFVFPRTLQINGKHPVCWGRKRGLFLLSANRLSDKSQGRNVIRDFKVQRRDGNKNVAQKVNFPSLSLYSDYSYPLTLSIVGEPS